MPAWDRNKNAMQLSPTIQCHISENHSPFHVKQSVIHGVEKIDHNGDYARVCAVVCGGPVIDVSCQDQPAVTQTCLSRNQSHWFVMLVIASCLRDDVVHDGHTLMSGARRWSRESCLSDLVKPPLGVAWISLEADCRVINDMSPQCQRDILFWSTFLRSRPSFNLVLSVFGVMNY